MTAGPDMKGSKLGAKREPEESSEGPILDHGGWNTTASGPGLALAGFCRWSFSGKWPRSASQ